MYLNKPRLTTRDVRWPGGTSTHDHAHNGASHVDGMRGWRSQRLREGTASPLTDDGTLWHDGHTHMRIGGCG
jgi:hypothetical protein